MVFDLQVNTVWLTFNIIIDIEKVKIWTNERFAGFVITKYTKTVGMQFSVLFFMFSHLQCLCGFYQCHLHFSFQVWLFRKRQHLVLQTFWIAKHTETIAQKRHKEQQPHQHLKRMMKKLKFEHLLNAHNPMDFSVIHLSAINIMLAREFYFTHRQVLTWKPVWQIKITNKKKILPKFSTCIFLFFFFVRQWR